MILYGGPSLIDGSPIVAIATSNSKNSKTGKMVQVWILRSDMSPVDAVREGKDSAICGNCPQRHYLGGACYVIPIRAPLPVYNAYKRGSYDVPKARTINAIYNQPIRLGAYGDPAAVPLWVWARLLSKGIQRWTGYTHQWQNPRVRNYRQFLMASVDNATEAKLADDLGWRYFQVATTGDDTTGAVECLSDARDLSCANCGICDGTRWKAETRRTSVYINVHGTHAKKFRQLTPRSLMVAA